MKDDEDIKRLIDNHKTCEYDKILFSLETNTKILSALKDIKE